MCANGVNTGQLEVMIEMIDDVCKVSRRQMHNLAHTAEDAGFQTVGMKLHAAQSMMDDVRALLDEAKDAIEDDAEAAGGVQVNLV
ncbi:MAG: dynein gamma chain protein [Eggerthellaceae bacterium]|nr:dynein gamma chain protein [Eggerthellaceae bacterium]